jgi:hypothetical protein
MILNPSIHALDQIITDLDAVLVSTYNGMDKVLEAHPNPLLLKQVLCHYYLFVHSQNATWPAEINALSKIDPALNTEVLNEVKAYRDANPN